MPLLAVHGIASSRAFCLHLVRSVVRSGICSVSTSVHPRWPARYGQLAARAGQSIPVPTLLACAFPVAAARAWNRFFSRTSYRGGECKQEPGMSHRWLTYLLTWTLLCISSPPEIWPLHFSDKSRQNSLLAVSLKWISVNVNMFAIYYLSQIHHSHWYCVLIHCSLLSIIGLIVWSWFTSRL